MKKIAAIIMMLVIAISMTACAPKENKENEGAKDVPTTEGKLIVGFDQNFPPMGFVGKDGEFTGFDLDLAKEAAKRMNMELVLQPIAWDSKDMELKAGNIDCIWNGFTINGREDKYTWTTAYMENEQVFVVKADANIKTLADLKGKTVTVQADSSAESALKDKADLVATFGNYLTSADYNAALMDLESGAVDAVAMDSIVADYQIEQRGDTLIALEESIASEQYGVGFLLGNEELRDKVQATLEEMAKDGKLAEISNTWFGKDVTTIGK